MKNIRDNLIVDTKMKCNVLRIRESQNEKKKNISTFQTFNERKKNRLSKSIHIRLIHALSISTLEFLFTITNIDLIRCKSVNFSIQNPLVICSLFRCKYSGNFEGNMYFENNRETNAYQLYLYERITSGFRLI